MSDPADNYVERTRRRTRGIEAGYFGAVIVATVITDLTNLIPMSVNYGNHLADRVGGSILNVALVGLWIAMMAAEWKHRHRLERRKYYRRAGSVNQALLVLLAAAFTAAHHPHRPSALAAIVVFNAGAAGVWRLWIHINALTPKQQIEFDRMVEQYEAVMVPQVYEGARRRNFEAAVAPYRLVDAEESLVIRRVDWNIPSGRHQPKVYFIVNGSRIKIGTTVDIRKRVRALSLRMDNVALLLPGDASVESAYHRQFDALRIGDTEWFAAEPDLVNFIAVRQPREQ